MTDIDRYKKELADVQAWLYVNDHLYNKLKAQLNGITEAERTPADKLVLKSISEIQYCGYNGWDAVRNARLDEAFFKAGIRSLS